MVSRDPDGSTWYQIPFLARCLSQADVRPALEVCLMLVHLPLRSVSGLPIPQDALVRNEYDDEWQTSLSILDIFTSRPGMVEKMINGWERLDNESYSEIQRYVAYRYTYKRASD